MSERYETEGEVGIVYEKKMDGYSLFSLKLEDDDTWYRLGNYDLRDEVNQGDYITFEYDVKRGQCTVDVGTVEVIEAAEEETYEEAASSATPTSGSNSKEATFGRKDLRISMQAARNAAVNVTALLLEHGALKLPAKTKVGLRNEAILEFINNLTEEYYMRTIAVDMDDFDIAAELRESGEGYVPVDSVYEEEEYFEDEVEEPEYEEEEYEDGDLDA